MASVRRRHLAAISNSNDPLSTFERFELRENPRMRPKRPDLEPIVPHTRCCCCCCWKHNLKSRHGSKEEEEKMNIPPIQQPGAMGMGQMTQPNNPQMAQSQQQVQQAQAQAQQQAQNQQQQQQAQEKLDNISKVKSLVGPLRESLAVTIKTAAQTLHQNSSVDVGTSKGTDPPDHRFNKNMEEFYSICDQIELHLKTSIECLAQSSGSARYLPMSVIATRTDAVSNQEGSALSYPQFLMTVRGQVAYAREIHDTLISAAHSIAPGE